LLQRDEGFVAVEDPKQNGMAFENPGSALDQIALLLSKQKLVPFFGAGLSRDHLGFAGAGLARDLAKQTNAPADTPLADLSDIFADQYGQDAFVAYLKRMLVVPALDDAKATGHLFLLSLTQNLLYTTNQDNIFELAAAKYGRPYRRVVTIDDLSEAAPGERLLVKFHGDPDVPSSLVFGTRSYKARIEAADHPLDIKLRADLLGKRLLFLGYSFGDENVAKLLNAVQRAFSGKLPESYLIAFEVNPAMEALRETYGITIVDPLKLFPEAGTAPAAFERCLKALCDRTISHQAKDGLESLVNDSPINPRVITGYELDAVARAIATEPFMVGVKAFRGTLGGTNTPAHLHERVTELFCELSDKVTASNDQEMVELRSAVANLQLPFRYAMEAMSSVLAACNRRPVRAGFDDMIAIYCVSMPDGTLPVAAAMAVGTLIERGEPITDNFRRLATFWFRDWDETDPQVRDHIKLMIDAAWRGSGSNFQALPKIGFRPKGVHGLANDFLSKFPQQFRNPES
jgi:hypothetical protein